MNSASQQRSGEAFRASSLIPYAEKASELVRLTEASHVPPGVKAAVLRFSDRPTKLFCWCGEIDPALGAPHSSYGLYASNLLCELVAAFVAFDWPKVLILVHDALPPKAETASEERDWPAPLEPSGMKFNQSEKING